MLRPPKHKDVSLSVRLLGPVDVRVGDEPLAVDTRKAVALLAYVAVAGRPMPREVLAALLWPDSAEAQARGALRRTLSVLNSGLAGGLVVDRTTVAIDPERLDLDLGHFRAALARARSHGHPPRQSCKHCRVALEEALDLARGPFMDGFALRDSEVFDEWLTNEREAYQRELVGALERQVLERLAAGAWDAAISAGRRWLDLDPLHEPAHRALMEAYARSGETAAAVQQYRDAAAILDRELGVAPLPETSDLYEAIVAGLLVADGSPDQSGPATIAPADAIPAAQLIGREAELQRLMHQLEASGSDGRVVAVEGEAGVGKSRLADALTEVASAAGHDVVAARCYAGETGIALGPIVALLRARLIDSDLVVTAADLPDATRETLSILLPELAPAGQSRAGDIGRGPAARLALFEAIIDGLAVRPASAQPRPTVVRLDDLQWADDSTLEVLAFLARRLAGRPVLVLLSWRREELDERTAPLIDELPPGARVRLERLAPVHIRDLIDALVAAGRPAPVPALVDRLVDEAEGLPLYVVEALTGDESAAGAVPAGIRALLQARLAALSGLAAQVAAAAAVIGRSFDPDTVRQVSGRSDEETVEAIEELTRRGIIVEAGREQAPGYDFTHARLRGVAYEDTSVARRRLLHRRAAEAYRSLGATSGDQLGRLARIAHHQQAAGRSNEAAEAFEQAGRLAANVYANREALAYLEAALALGHPDVAAIHEGIADVRARVGDYPGAITAYETAAATAPRGRLAGIEHRVGRIHLRRGDLAAAEAHLLVAYEAIDPDDVGSNPTRSGIQADRAVVAVRAGSVEQAKTLAEQARELAGGDASAEAEADRIRGLLARERGEPVEARTLLERSLAAAQGLEDPLPMIAATNALALVAADRGEAETAIALIETALATARRTGERHLEAALENNLADALESVGRRTEAMEHLKAAAAAFADVAAVTDEPEPGIWMLESW